MALKRVCSVDEVQDRGMKPFIVDGVSVLVLRAGDEYFACQADCPHEATPLSEGIFDGSVMTCHRHLWQWDIATGTPMGAAECRLTTYAVEVRDGGLFVQLQDASVASSS